MVWLSPETLCQRRDCLDHLEAEDSLEEVGLEVCCLEELG